MPTLVIRSTVNCCTSRHPPSPDGVAPRPVTAPAKERRKISKGPAPTWTTTEAREFQAIFKEEPSQGSSLSQERNTSGAKYRAIFEGDEILETSEDEHDFQLDPVKSKKSSISLKAVTEKLKKHLSKESNLNKRHSRSSVGTTEEEIGRRAELRRLRQKRIQEELSSERDYDEDAKSLCSIPIIETPSKRKSEACSTRKPSVTNTDCSAENIRTSSKRVSERTQTFPRTRLSRPINAPFPPSPSMRSLRLARNPVNPSNKITLAGRSVVRRQSLPAFKSRAIGTPEPEIFRPRRRSSLPVIPSQPILHPQHLPGVAVPAKSSWRLSFTSDNRGTLLRKLSRSKAPSPRHKLPQFEINDKPMKHWLHSQGLRSSSQTPICEKTLKQVSLELQPRQRIPSPDYGGVDGSEEGIAMVPLHKMRISQYLTSRSLQGSSSSPQLSCWGSYQRGQSSSGGNSQPICKDRDRYLRSTSDSMSLSERIPQTWGKILSEGISAFNPSPLNSAPLSSDTSRFSLMSIISKSKSHSNITTPEDRTTSTPFLGLSSISTRNLSTTSLTLPLTRYPRNHTNDDSSLLISETDSFRAREAELSLIQTRFVASDSRRPPGTPVSSKFREEFDFKPPSPQPQPARRKSSAFARLAKLASLSYDGEGYTEDVMNVPMPNFDASRLRRDEDDGGIWGKPKKKDKKKGKEEDDVKGAFGNLGFGKGKKKKEEPKDLAAEYQKAFEERLAVKELVMDDWEAEMNATAAKAAAKSRNIVKKSKPTGPDRRYPTSWSKYPSHTRHERTASATTGEGVERKDFAILGKDANGEDIWCLSHDDDGHHTFLDYLNQRKKLKERLEAKLEDALYHLDTEHGSASEVRGRRSSLNPAGDLEFPELEIMPVTLMPKEELEDSAQRTARREEMERKRKKLELAVGLDEEKTSHNPLQKQATLGSFHSQNSQNSKNSRR